MISDEPPSPPPSWGGVRGGLGLRLRRHVARLLGLRLSQILGVHERGLLLERLRRQVVDILTVRSEAQVEALDVLTGIEILLLAATGALHSQIEHAEVAELHLLALQQLLKDTRLQLVGHTEADILTVDGVVLRHVLTEFGIRHGLGGYHSTVELAVGLRGRVLVLESFVKYWHKLEIEN